MWCVARVTCQLVRDGNISTAICDQFVLCNNILVNELMPAHQTSDMSRCTISPESRSKLDIVILSSLGFLTI